MRIFDTENKQTGQLIFFIFGHFDKKTKNEKWNETDKSKKSFGRLLLETTARKKLSTFLGVECPADQKELLL
jgi:hypothetical protein